MRYAGIALITLGFLAGALVSVWEKKVITVNWYLVSLALGIAGVVVARLAAMREATHPDRVAADFEALEKSLETAVRELDEFDDLAERDTYAVPDRIDEKLRDPLTAFAASREAILHIYGARAYADVMSPFAAGERYLNRVWSAAAEGYVDEATTYLARSREQFADSLAALEKVHAENEK